MVKTKTKKQTKSASAGIGIIKTEFTHKMSSSIKAELKKITKAVKELEILCGENSKKKKCSSKKASKEPELIYDCKSKKDLENFKISELKEFIEENKISTKNLCKRCKKDDYVDLIWKSMKKFAKKDKRGKKCDSSSESESESDSDWDSDSDSD
jgi:hypothetical protein